MCQLLGDASNVINDSPAHDSCQYVVSRFVMEERRRQAVSPKPSIASPFLRITKLAAFDKSMQAMMSPA